jgi:hypothetical protein
MFINKLHLLIDQGRIRVYARVRPMEESEQSNNEPFGFTSDDSTVPKRY